MLIRGFWSQCFVVNPYVMSMWIQVLPRVPSLSLWCNLMSLLSYGDVVTSRKWFNLRLTQYLHVELDYVPSSYDLDMSCLSYHEGEAHKLAGIDVRKWEWQPYMLSFCELLAICISTGFKLPPIPKLENAELADIMQYYVMLLCLNGVMWCYYA